MNKEAIAARASALAEGQQSRRFLKEMLPPVLSAPLLAGALILVIVISFIDVTTGFIPDVTIFYLIPVVAVAAFLGLRYGLIAAIVAGAAELYSNIRLGVTPGVDLIADAFLHSLVFLLGAALIDRVLSQLRSITRLEEQRSHDIELAKDIHSSIFAPLAHRYRDFSVGSKLAFARELGGDYYHLSDLNGKLFFCIGDISGKGIGAALFSVLLHQTVLDARRDTTNLQALVSEINSRLYAALPDDMFITFFAALFGRESLEFVNAGHELPLLYSRKEGSIRALQGENALPLGLSPSLEIQPQEESFSPGDILLGVTDGVTGSPSLVADPIQGLEKLLRDNLDAKPQDIAETVYDRAIFNQEQPSDDIIAVCIKREARHLGSSITRRAVSEAKRGWERKISGGPLDT